MATTESPKPSKKRTAAKQVATSGSKAKFPRHSVAKAIRIAQAILDQNAGKACSRAEAARFLGLRSPAGRFGVEISSAIKYGFIEQPESGSIQPSALAKKILHPQSPNDTIDGYREAVMNAPDIAQVFQHYRGENLPDDQILRNTVVDTYKVPVDSFQEFRQVFLESLETAQLISRHGGEIRVTDIPTGDASIATHSDRQKQLEKSTGVGPNDSRFITQPFAAPLEDYHEKICRPAPTQTAFEPLAALSVSKAAAVSCEPRDRSSSWLVWALVLGCMVAAALVVFLVSSLFS